MLSWCELLYNLTEWEIWKLEKSDEMFLSKVMDCSSQVAGEVIALKLAILLVRYNIKMKRVIYLYHILREG